MWPRSRSSNKNRKSILYFANTFDTARTFCRPNPKHNQAIRGFTVTFVWTICRGASCFEPNAVKRLFFVFDQEQTFEGINFVVDVAKENFARDAVTGDKQKYGVARCMKNEETKNNIRQCRRRVHLQFRAAIKNVCTQRSLYVERGIWQSVTWLAITISIPDWHATPFNPRSVRYLRRQSDLELISKWPSIRVKLSRINCRTLCYSKYTIDFFAFLCIAICV